MIHDDDDEPDQLPEFTNLKHLEFTLGNKDYYYDLFEAYIEACPCLETIVLKVGIFDATNNTKKRRNMLMKMAEGKCKIIFLETICNDERITERSQILRLDWQTLKLDYLTMKTVARQLI
ncbi:hypothetical protein FEM48_Zijuj05G0135500 [Ziziphus jujuba var. spinosa]|uniref:6-phosphofructo-2-kinase domain-containing protein n=1 Tax=Ziziphus jujuba var. spinosa TaxID=714518 RepID=A0A978VF46_ZIZJJ|nr:hypothetical protein FEM48_Zijuj05G0135500 [Ziziphus jujuba var. spinosa]